MPTRTNQNLKADSLRRALTGKGRSRRNVLSALGKTSPARNGRNNLIPQLDFVERAPKDLALPSRTVRKIAPAHLAEVICSIQSFGFCDPPLIDDSNKVLDGVIRVEAAKRLGLPSISCLQVGHLSSNELRLLRLALNRLGEKGQWDLGELKIEIDELTAEGVAIETSGFTLAEIDHIIIDEACDPVEPGPLAPSPDAKTVAGLGDVFLLGKHRLICADATALETYASLMQDKYARLVLTDQPYNVPIAGHVTKGEHHEFVMASGEMSPEQFSAFNHSWLSAASQQLMDGGLLCTFIDWRGYPSVHEAALAHGLTQLNLVVWAKTNAGMGSLYRSQHELLPLYKKGDAAHVNNIELGKNGRWRSNVWTHPGANSLGSDSRDGLQFHPTVKPVSMLEDALMDVTNKGDIVLDPFLGSGSTLIAAEQRGRICYGIELDPQYVDLIVRRFEETAGTHVIHEETGETFEQLRAQRRDALYFTP
jgi:DNA modification methylase